MKARFIIQAMGSPKKLLMKTITNIKDSLKKNYKIEDEFLDKPKKSGDSFFITFLEITISFNSIEDCFDFMMKYTPTTMEIIKPFKFELSAGELENISNDILGKVHEMDKKLKTQISVNKILSRKVIRSNTARKL